MSRSFNIQILLLKMLSHKEIIHLEIITYRQSTARSMLHE